MLNKVILIGRLCAEPELKYLPANGTAVANFTLAVNRKFNKDETDFIDIVVWKKPAENCAEYLGKGSLCAVDGRIQVRTYEDKEGKKRKVTEVVAEDVRFLDSKNKSDGPRQKREEADWSEVGADMPLGDDSDDQIPF